MIDKSKLKELTEDPNSTSVSIWEGLGFNNSSAFYYQLNRDVEALAIVNGWRAARAGGGDGKTSARAPRKAGKRTAKRSAPPRKQSAKGSVSAELLRKIRHEFEHIALYEQISDHFEEVSRELAEV